MKLISQLNRWAVILLLIPVLVISCQKSDSGNLSPEQEEQASSFSSEADAEADVVFNDVFDNVMGVNDDVGMSGTGVFGAANTSKDGSGYFDLSGRTDTSRCFTVTVITSSTGSNTSVFPVKVIVDFGAGCLGHDGHTRSGKIITVYTARLIVPGAKATTTFDNFYFDNIHVEGTHVITNTSTANVRQFKIIVENAKLTKPNGNYSQWNRKHTITQVEGLGTPNIPLDDIFKIEGSGNGKVKRGDVIVGWNAEIIEPLVKRFTCHWIVRGVVRVARLNLSTNSPWVAKLNYGNGLCDNKAVLTINGVSKEITLP